MSQFYKPQLVGEIGERCVRCWSECPGLEKRDGQTYLLRCKAFDRYTAIGATCHFETFEAYIKYLREAWMGEVSDKMQVLKMAIARAMKATGKFGGVMKGGVK